MITLTREEAQSVLDVIQYLAVPDRHNIEDKSDVIRLVAGTLRARLAQPEPPCKTGSQCIGGKCPQCAVREWQGLTDEEVMSLLPGAVRLPPGWADTVRAIEAKLREKNT